MTTTLDTAAVFRDRISQIGISKSEVAKRAGITRSQLYGYLSGDHVPSVDTFVRLLSVLGLQIDLEPTIEWTVAERAAQRSLNAARLEMQSAGADRTRVSLANFLAISA